MSNETKKEKDLSAWRAEHPSLWVRINYRLITLCGQLSAILFVLVAVIITYEVIARYVFTAPTIWSEDISLLCQIWATCLGASWVLQHKALIRIDFLTSMLGERVRKMSDFVALLSIIFFAGFVAYYGFELLRESIEMGSASASMLGLPLWATKSAIPVGFGLLTLQAILEMVLLFASDYQEHEEVSL
ncbi:TRAP transporter small permease [Marinomonas algicola]|uniref:TRAP transporter small permease n=1 Tax=Marinomonas algicola TaxID=2773454 RepID=UPI00174D69A1|nr:TRAP transporter small permease [Marinomonas algicola]